MTIEVPESNIAKSFEMLFEDEQSSDVTFSVGGNKFYAHKIVLAARSSVFKSQFFGGTDKVDREILVNDMEPKVFKVPMLTTRSCVFKSQLFIFKVLFGVAYHIISLVWFSYLILLLVSRLYFSLYIKILL